MAGNPSPAMKPYRDYVGPPWGSLTGIVGYAEGKEGEGAGGDHFTEDAHSSQKGGIYYPPLPGDPHRHYRKRSD